MCKPVLPFLQDEIAHIFWKAQHVATVHHHHGNHHAQHEVAAATQEEQGPKGNATTKTSEPVSIHLGAEHFYTISQISVEKQQFGTPIFGLLSLALTRHFPPPRFS